MLQLNFNPFPVIETERLVLRRFTDDDAPDLFEVRRNPDVMKHIARPLAKSVDDASALIKVLDDNVIANNGITWCITLKGENRFIGSIGFWRVEKDDYRAEIGYLLDPAYHGKGIMHEAVEVIINYGFKQMGLHSIQANVAPHNSASIKLLEKHHFIREAHFKENFFFNGSFLDTVVYSLLTKN